jgi:hypothetical protein
MTESEFQGILAAVIAKSPAHEIFRTKSDPAHPDYVPGIRESIALIHRGETRKPRPPAPIVTEFTGPAASPAATAAIPSVKLTVVQSLAFQAEAKECPHRTRDAGCGCCGHRCARGKGRDGLVNDWDCLGCLGFIDESGNATEKGLAPITEPSIEPSSSGYGS